jgi:hypothetical protein
MLTTSPGAKLDFTGIRPAKFDLARIGVIYNRPGPFTIAAISSENIR